MREREIAKREICRIQISEQTRSQFISTDEEGQKEYRRVHSLWGLRYHGEKAQGAALDVFEKAVANVKPIIEVKFACRWLDLPGAHRGHPTRRVLWVSAG
jgi:hypothetical protein